jgi:hypothetical protein
MSHIRIRNQMNESMDTDPYLYKNVTDPEHWFLCFGSIRIQQFIIEFPLFFLSAYLKISGI